MGSKTRRSLGSRFMRCDVDIEYFKKFLRLSKRGEIRLVAASVENLRRETESGHQCYLVIMDPLKKVNENEK